MISNDLLDLVKHFEGCRLTAYRDSGGILSIGFGHTKNVKEGDAITLDDAEKLLKIDLANAELRAKPYLKGLSQCKKDALISQAFNLRSFEQLANHLNESEYIYIKKALLYVRDSKGHELKGLKRRRTAEVLMFLGQTWEQIEKVIC